MAKTKCQSRYQKESPSFGTRNAGGRHGFWKDVINSKKKIDYYAKEYDLTNLLPEDDGSTLGVKVLLFSLYEDWNGFMGGSRDEYAQSFKNWYLEKYVAKTKTHRQQLNR